MGRAARRAEYRHPGPTERGASGHVVQWRDAGLERREGMTLSLTGWEWDTQKKHMLPLQRVNKFKTIIRGVVFGLLVRKTLGIETCGRKQSDPRLPQGMQAFVP